MTLLISSFLATWPVVAQAPTPSGHDMVAFRNVMIVSDDGLRLSGRTQLAKPRSRPLSACATRRKLAAGVKLACACEAAESVTLSRVFSLMNLEGNSSIVRPP